MNGPAHRHKKRFGQNFLRDRGVVERILAAAALDPGDRVVEIGPGMGALTDPMLSRAGEVHILEIDRELAARWRERPEAHLRVHEGDALDLDWPRFLTTPPYKMVANLPYNISSQVLFKILDHRELFSRLVLMFQKEVGERLCAGPGSRDYGILSVLCQLWFDIRRVILVKPGSFYPPPKVDSVVLSFDPLASARVPVEDWMGFRRTVKAAFGQRRKSLRNALTGGGWSVAQAEEALRASGIDPSRRAETLSLDEFARLSRQLGAPPSGRD